jgi:hypothetical protein
LLPYFSVRPECDIPGFRGKVPDAAIVAIHAQQFVLTLSGNSCP